ncbi:hypothetical protein [Bacillus thuringiensis]|uniref:GIY-YIG domain-containing protein n=1 Tax=Bacillus thuringiensis serovar toumanoffi TaxID=180862 RepID=A0ABD5HR30_BACTU|nr:hypothetical protein [Bacillus thuringiensis]EEM95445.1 hypothetical protein bthur0013_32670 [Bacillus thuringiensis IBL 200]MCR6784049.1 hypothetical protein [Bacillus thuringiensis]MCR6861677.1 hypothetical protein [Bacillus thuringiensis]MCR6868535.1 hypothetical protein [Bacillus thuringiensis]MDW9207402.1 hypothetical protein [Bacillus thuringiensis serovar toumanoffi]
MKDKTELPIGSNFGISMVESYGMFFRHYDFEKLLEFENEYNIIPKMHIYMVVKVPKTIFVSDCIKIDKEYIHLKIRIMDNRADNEFEVKVINKSKKTEQELEVVLSHNRDDIEIKDAVGNYVLKANSFMLLILNEYVMDCEVVYIGRSFGKEGERTVYNRLKSHSTLQKIYAEKEDDKSIFLSAWNYDRNTIGFISPLESDDQKSVNIFMKHMEISGRPYDLIRKKQEINFTEAALIRYFQPKYNDLMKYRFPSRTHTEYSDLFKEDIDYISLEIDTKRLCVKLYSEAALAYFKHSPFFDLKDKRSKYDFFRII